MCFGDFSVIVDPPNPIPTLGSAKRVIFCIYNAFGEAVVQKALIFRDFMAAEVLDGLGRP